MRAPYTALPPGPAAPPAAALAPAAAQAPPCRRVWDAPGSCAGCAAACRARRRSHHVGLLQRGGHEEGGAAAAPGGQRDSREGEQRSRDATGRDGTGRTRRHYTVPRPRPAALLGGSRAARRGRGWAGADSPDLPWFSWAAVPRSRALAPGLRRASPAAQPGPFPLPPPLGARPERGPDWPAAPSRFLQPAGTPGLLASRALLGDGRAHSPLHFLILEILFFHQPGEQGTRAGDTTGCLGWPGPDTEMETLLQDVLRH